MQQEEEAAVQQQEEEAVAMEAAVVVQQPQQGSSSSAAASCSSSSSSSAAASSTSSRKRSRSAAALPAAARPAAAMCELVVRVRRRCRAREGAALRGARCAAAPPARVCLRFVLFIIFVSRRSVGVRERGVRAWSYSLLRPIFYTPLDSLTKFLSERTRSPFGRSDRCLARGREHTVSVRT